MKQIPVPQLNLILLGDVAAGKATQSAYFAKKYKLFDFDMGRELTILREKQRAVDQILKKNSDKGILAPTRLCRQILRQTISKLPRSQGILFDGHPKMVQEARLVSQLLRQTGRPRPLVLYLTIPLAETKKRIALRQGYAGTKTRHRSDDTVLGLQNRAKYYRSNIQQVIKYFSSVYEFEKISGLGTPAQVRVRIQKAVDRFVKNYGKVNQDKKRH